MKNKFVYLFILLLWLIVSYNSQFKETTFLGFGINVLLEAALLVLMVPYFFKKINSYQKWVLIILFFWGASVTWSVNNAAFDLFYSVTIIYLLCFFLSSIISTKKDVELVLKLELTAVFLCGIYVLLFVNVGNVTEVRLGDESEGLWNANDIGLKMSVGYAISLYYLLKGKANKILLYGLMLLFIAIGLMSGSRKVIILLVIFTALLIIIRAKRDKKIIYTAIAALFVATSYFMIMNIPFLYEMVGRRIDMMLEGLSGNGGGHSMEERSLMIAYGIDFIGDKLWLGNGFNAFSFLFGSITGWYTYSHNNFIELLVNTGVIGLILYYSLTVYILKMLWQPAIKERDTLSQVLLLYTLVSTLLDYAIVSYPSIPTIFRLMYTARYCQIINENAKYVLK